tara:strand:- start:1620 stop:2510 length:891 start_codon:yes stop_codon:yes gene_type:complete
MNNLTDKTGDVISVQNLSYTYPRAASPALTGISLQVRAGEIFGLLGPSGAGKSTLQRLLTRQIRHFTEGQVRVLGRDIRDWDQNLYESVGVGFELPNHYIRLTGRENLRFFSRLYRSPTRDPQAVLELVGLAEAADKRVADYSKGMQVRLNFARAILHDPGLLFLDEPTTGLDPTTSAALKAVILRLRDEGKTIVLTTHNMHDADELCDRVGFIARGKLTSLDSPQNLKQAHGERQVEVTLIDGRAERFALDGIGENPAFQSLLQAGPVRSIHSSEASLDQVFRIVTGTELHRETS